MRNASPQAPAARQLGAYLGTLLLAASLHLPAYAAEPPASESPEARIARLEAEERQLRREQQPTRAAEVLRELVDALKGNPRQQPLLLSLYITERDSGNHAEAARLRKKLLEIPRLHDGVRIGLYFRDAQYRAWMGDTKGARSLWQEGSTVVANLSPNDRIAQRLKHRYLSRQAVAEATLLRMEGDLEGAAKAMQHALEENAADLQRFARAADNTSSPGTPAEGRDIATAETDRAILMSEIIGLHIQNKRLGAAELVALEWLNATLQAGTQQRHALFARKRYGDVMLAAGRCQKALLAFDRVIADYRAQSRSEISSNLIFAKRSRVQTLMCLDRWDEALRGFQEIEQETRGKAAREIVRAGIDRALVRAMTNNLKVAEDIINGAVASLSKSYGPDHADTIVASGIRALILSRSGRDAEALPLFRRFVEARVVASGDGPQDGEEAAPARLRKRLILEAYLATLSRQPANAEALATAFQVADVLRAGRVQQAIAASAARGNISNPALAELVRKEQNQSAELAALYRALGEQGSESGTKAESADQPDLRPRIAALEQQRKEALADIRQQFPDYFLLIRPTPPTPKEVGEVLAADEVLVSIYTAPEASYVFTVVRGGEAHLHVAALGSRAAAEAVRKLRQALDVGDVPLERLPPFDIATAHQLYALLLEPLRSHWESASQMIVSASGVLGQLPFSLLLERPGSLAKNPLLFAAYADLPWLVKTRAISHVPSAAAFIALRRLPAASTSRTSFVGFGDPEFGAAKTPSVKLRNAPRRGAQGVEGADGSEGTIRKSLRAAYLTLPPLPDTRDEVLALAKALKARPEDAVLGKAASRDSVMHRDLSRSAVLAFATHGLQPGELPGLDEPALAMTLPPSEEQSPLLTLSDVLSLKLDADWVLLSACNTAGADGEAAEALSGLGRGFFFAGARALLVTHWPVESVSARLLVSGLFSQMKSASRAEGLRQAQLELMRQSAGRAFSYAHPLFWAPFALVGDGGGAP